MSVSLKRRGRSARGRAGFRRRDARRNRRLVYAPRLVRCRDLAPVWGFQPTSQASRLAASFRKGQAALGMLRSLADAAMAPEPEQPPASPVGPARGLSLEQSVTRSDRDHLPTPTEKPGVAEFVVEPRLEPRKPAPPVLIPAEPGLSLEVLMMRERSPAPAPARAAFDSWVNEAMHWPEPGR